MISEIELEKTPLNPIIKWYQNINFIILSIELSDGKDVNINFEEKEFFFKGYSNNIKYEIEFKLFDTINKDESIYVVNQNTIKVSLKKMNTDSWNYLTNDKNLYKNNIKIDWNNWVNDSDDDEPTNNENNSQFDTSQFDFQKMMESMQGMGGMPGMDGMSGMDGMPGMDGMDGMSGMDGMDGMQKIEAEDYCDDDDDDDDDTKKCNDERCAEKCNDESCCSDAGEGPR